MFSCLALLVSGWTLRADGGLRRQFENGSQLRSQMRSAEAETFGIGAQSCIQRYT